MEPLSGGVRSPGASLRVDLGHVDFVDAGQYFLGIQLDDGVLKRTKIHTAGSGPENFTPNEPLLLPLLPSQGPGDHATLHVFAFRRLRESWTPHGEAAVQCDIPDAPRTAMPRATEPRASGTSTSPSQPDVVVEKRVSFVSDGPLGSSSIGSLVARLSLHVEHEPLTLGAQGQTSTIALVDPGQVQQAAMRAHHHDAQDAPRGTSTSFPEEQQQGNDKHAQVHAQSMGDLMTSGVLKEELERHQARAAILEAEAERRTEAIETCRMEILELRRQATRSREELAEKDRLVRHLQEQQRQDVGAALSLIGDPGLHLPPDPVAKLRSLAQAHYQLVQEFRRASTRFNEQQGLVGQLQDLQEKYSELQKAHLMQAAYVQSLQADKSVKQVETFRNAVKLQEDVIKSLESRLERAEAQPHSSALERGKPHSGRAAVSHVRTRPDAPVQVSELQALLHTKDARIVALENQLVDESRRNAREASALKLRVFELETELGLC